MNGIFHRFAARAGLPRCGGGGEHGHAHCAFHIDHTSHGRLRTTRLFNTSGLLRHYDHVMGTAPRRVITLLREPVQTFLSRCVSPPFRLPRLEMRDNYDDTGFEYEAWNCSRHSFFYYVEPSQRARRPAAAQLNETGTRPHTSAHFLLCSEAG